MSSAVKDAFAVSNDSLKVLFMAEDDKETGSNQSALAYFRLQTRFNQRGKTQAKQNNETRVTVTSSKDPGLSDKGDLWKQQFEKAEDEPIETDERPAKQEAGLEIETEKCDDQTKPQSDSLDRLPALVTTSVEFMPFDLARELVDRQVRFKKLFNKVISGTLVVKSGIRKIGHLRKTEIRFLNDAKERLEKRLVDLKSTAFKKICVKS